MVWFGSESGAIIDKEIYKDFVNELKTYHNYIVSAEEKHFLKICFRANC